MSYSYVDFIKTPNQLGISDKGTIETLKKDIDGLIAYSKLLLEGPSKASKATGNGVLGNQFFVKTIGKCNGMTGPLGFTGMQSTGSQDRYFYVNNKPLGLLPLTGAHDSRLRGLVPGMTTNLEILDPTRISDALSTPSNPDCAQITMTTVGNTGVVGSETHYVALSDIAKLDPCLFGSKKANPLTKGKACEYFTNNEVDAESDSDSDDGVEYGLMDIITNDIQNDYISQLFVISFSFFGIYLLYSIINKSKH